MEARDRRTNLMFFGAAFVAWLVVAAIVLTQDPILVPAAGYLGALAMGVAVGLTSVPLFWLAPFARQRRIAYRGAWTRSIRRGLWVSFIVFLLVVLRVQSFFQPQLALFIIAMILVAETTLSAGR
jgi:hypothetical protein